jgi:hypothetical protein
MSILAALAKIGAIYAQKAAAKSTEVGAPKNISKAFSVDPPMQREATYYIDIKVHLKEAPAAGAYEWGSGIHATKGKRGTYIIAPRTKGALAFFWDKVDEGSKTGAKFRGISPTTGKAIFSYVDHPGVAPRPYLVPTIHETKNEFKKILGQGFKAEILQGVNKIEVIEIK